MNIEQYLEIREAGKQLAEKIFIWGKGKFDFRLAGKKLGLLVNNTLVYDDETDLDNMQDFMLHNSKYKGMRILDLFYDSDVELDDLEELVLEGMVNSKLSIFEIQDIDAGVNRYRVILKDLLQAGTYEMIDLGFAQTALRGQVIFTRLIPLKDKVHMSSGCSFVFRSVDKDRLLAEYSFDKIKQGRKLNEEDLFLFCNKKNKLYGQQVRYKDQNEQ